MADLKPHNHLNDNFYTTPRFAHQTMTLKQWQETMLFTNGYILSVGESWRLKQEYLGGGMRDVRVEQTYWKNGRPVKKKEVKFNGS